jgi:hypothetical protein
MYRYRRLAGVTVLERAVSMPLDGQIWTARKYSGRDVDSFLCFLGFLLYRSGEALQALIWGDSAGFTAFYALRF